MGRIFECHPLQEINLIFCKATSITVTADGKSYLFLAIIVAVCTLTFVTTDFYAQDYLFATNRKTNKVANAKNILDKMRMTALEAAFWSLFTFNM